MKIDWLILVPTQRELELLVPESICRAANLRAVVDQEAEIAIAGDPRREEFNASLAPEDIANARFELCGFGPIAAAATVSRLVGIWRPKQAMLLGIAGSFGPADEIGTALVFSHVSCWGVGAGSGKEFVPCEAFGFTQLSLNGSSSHENVADSRIPLVQYGDRECLLLTACSASGSEADRASRLGANPQVRAEDMEGFGVALACRQFAVPVTIVRGISNCVGDRNQANWKIDAALASARTAAINVLGKR